MEHSSDIRVAGNRQCVGPVDNQTPKLLWKIQPEVVNLLIYFTFIYLPSIPQVIGPTKQAVGKMEAGAGFSSDGCRQERMSGF